MFYSADGGKASGGASGGSEADVAPLLVDGKPHLPFQLQIEYTGQDGSRCMRVITQAKPITTDRGVAESGTYCCTADNRTLCVSVYMRYCYIHVGPELSIEYTSTCTHV